MRFLREFDDVGFDIEKVKNAVDVYSSSVGIQCIVIDSNGNTIYNTFGACCFCRMVSPFLGERQSCSNVHLYGSYQAERFGGKYVFFCPMGLVHWASPIITNGIMRGAVLGGPVQMVDPDEFLIDEFIQKSMAQMSSVVDVKKHIENIRKEINNIPVIKPEMVNNLSELLFIVATHISDIQPIKYLDERESQEQQSDISEYIHYIKTMGGKESSLSEYPLEKEKELLTLISIGDKAGSQKVLNEILGHIFFSTGGNLELVKSRVLELIVLLSRAALEGGADVEQIFGLNYKYINQIHGFCTIEELTYWLSEIMHRFTDLVFNLTDVKHADVIFKAVDYIKQNYMKKITLDDVAAHVYLSPSYFSKVFKEGMKCNFNIYLNRVRIEASKNLLLDDSIMLVDLSNLVGFEDQSYFSKVFKKMTGVSPGRYRESRGQIVR